MVSLLDVWYVGNPKANVYRYLMAINPHVQHSLLLFRELGLLATSWLYSAFQSKAG